ncbi:DUF1501 domain-containing protein [Marmoricola sp. RAF53]|uniref:DUF1501 domain-containing protein n=1 Tax=Marmoricola sp. RAF53 TaxID=3233059 RepID=UPI003F9C735C
MTDCCDEYDGLSRRGLLRGALGVLGAGAGTAMFGTTFLQTSYAATRRADKVVVLISLRGAADGMSLVVPHGDPAYYSARPRIAVPAASLLARDSFFGLHPALAPLLPLWNAGKVAAVHATGMPVANRSHFAAMEALEDADPGSTQRVGWINRLIGRDGYTNPLQAVGYGMTSPITALYGPQGTVTAGTVDQVVLAGVDQWDHGRRRASLGTLWGGAGGPLGRGARAAFSTVTDIAPARRVSATPAGGAAYPDDDLGAALRSAARTIKGEVGAEVIAVDHDGGWDMHTGLGTITSGAMLRAAGSLASAVAAFFTDLGPWADRVTVVTLSEFGRRVRENASAGLDHGHGNVMFLIGGGVKGGYYGTWPGLTNSLDADLAVTTDYRSVLAELVSKRLGASTATVFPGFTPEAVGAFA